MIIQKVGFTGIDTDTDVHSDEWVPGSYRYALNVHVGSSEAGNVGSVENIKGNSLVSFSLPAGTNKVIGSFEDVSDQSIYYFLYNSNDDHGIYKYDSNTNSISLILEWDGLDFSATSIITGVGKIGRMLGWTDFTKPPRAIDLIKISDYASMDLSEEFISLIKRPPNYHPIITLKEDGSYTSNFIEKRFFQFRTMFVYEDDSHSAWSPISQLAINNLTYSVLTVMIPNRRGDLVPFSSYVTEAGDENYIEIDLNISELLASDRVNMVKKIMVAVREGNAGTFGIFKSLTRAEFTAIDGNIVNFYNDSTITAISDKEDEKLFDPIPLLSGAMAAAKSRFFLGNNVIGYSKPDAVTFVATPTYNTFDPSFFGKLMFKKRGVFQFGIFYTDDNNRSSGVITGDDAIVHITGGYCNNINLVLTATPPIWAKYFHVVRTEDQHHGFFLPIKVTDTKYLTGFNSSTGAAEYTSTFNQMNFETHLGFNAGAYANIAYNYADGDRIYIEYETSAGVAQTIDLPIKSIFIGVTEATVVNTVDGPRQHRGEVGSNFGKELIEQQVGVTKIVVENFNFGREITYAEVYSPAAKTGIFYEIGHIYPITDAGTVDRALSQTSIDIDRGDIYIISRKIEKRTLHSVDYIYRITIESMSQFDDNFEIRNDDKGRTNAVIEDEKQELKITGLMFSNPYIQNTKINGVSSFDTGDEDTLSIENGEITKLQIASNNQSNGSVMLAIHKNEISSVYIGEAVITDNRGQEFLAATDKVIGTIRPLAEELGSVNPESIVQENGRVWGWDVNKGVVWRYGGDGLTRLSDALMKKHFYDKSRELLPLTGTSAHAVYDPYFNEYILCLNNGTTSETIAFNENEKVKRWTTFYSFAPECFQKVNTRVVSFVDGALYLHGANATYNNFYGVQYTSKIQPVCNIEPSKEKILLNVGTESKDLWAATEITNDEGQETNLVAGDYFKLANSYSANVLRDVNTPNIDSPKIPILHGDVMRSSAFNILMENTKTTFSTLSKANFKVIASERSNK